MNFFVLYYLYYILNIIFHTKKRVTVTITPCPAPPQPKTPSKKMPFSQRYHSHSAPKISSTSGDIAATIRSKSGSKVKAFPTRLRHAILMQWKSWSLLDSWQWLHGSWERRGWVLVPPVFAVKPLEPRVPLKKPRFPVGLHKTCLMSEHVEIRLQMERQSENEKVQ